jgi:hypothetical protein
MLRSLYRWVLSLHPPGFRERFAEEMLSIFDHSLGKTAELRLLADGWVSLARQWTLRPEFRHDLFPAQQPAPDGIPSFHTLDPFRPRAGAVIHGLVLSTAIFCLTCFAIRYSWIHVLHVRIPQVQFDRPRPVQTNPGSGASESSGMPMASPHSEARSRSLPPAPLRSSSKAPKAALASRTSKTRVAKSSAETTALQLTPAGPLVGGGRVVTSSAASIPLESGQPTALMASRTRVNRASLQSYVGPYVTESPSNLAILITAEGGRLMMKIDGQPRRELVQASETKFVARGMENCWIEFSADAANPEDDRTIGSQFQLFQNGQEFIARRK